MVVVQEVEYTAVPYSIQPTTEDEALHGKAVLLTDCEISTLLLALPKITVDCDADEECAIGLFTKLFKLWQHPHCPNSPHE